ncbi:hypothetical protein [Micromonospora mirobrigensis]|uniref:Uncharacterized protein n=1 Tax=Micromonospora mirobrigensis TaxID=262898 RepID=A0A1C4WHZ6_9ACTN|nr:hypothetical protein [Micromonospora mirobrigensis]SCE95803.1 hypothetical protein GA0070564_102283 [Micromonospora mirobrigensis]
MTVLKGLREALFLIVVAGLVAAVAVGIWVASAGGDFVHRFGIALVAIALLLAITGDLTLSRIGMLGARTTFGLPPEREDAGGGRVLTGVGIFLFVSLPLLVLGVMIAG